MIPTSCSIRSTATSQRAARQLLLQLRATDEPTILLWQVLGESTQQIRSWRDQAKLTAAEFSEHLMVLRHLFPLMLPTVEAFDFAINLADRFSLSHWDSMILCACKAAGVSRLYTEDMGAPRTIDGIELVNPFV